MTTLTTIEQDGAVAASSAVNAQSERAASATQGAAVSASLTVGAAGWTTSASLASGVYHAYLVGLDPTNEIELVTTSSATPTLAGSFGAVGTRYTTGVVFQVAIIAGRAYLSARTASGAALTLALTRVA